MKIRINEESFQTKLDNAAEALSYAVDETDEHELTCALDNAEAALKGALQQLARYRRSIARAKEKETLAQVVASAKSAGACSGIRAICECVYCASYRNELRS